jgi:predicted nucleic-acid-binding Zn-ribbon protein/peroxiredoxin
LAAEPNFIAPNLALTGDGGEETQLASLWAERPLILAFFGDWANPFTGDNAAQLRDADEAFARADADIAAIVTWTHEQALTFRQYLYLPYPILSDPERRAFDAFNVKPDGSATFIVATDGHIAYARHATNLADYPPTSTLITAVCELTGAEPPAPPPATIFTLPYDAPDAPIEKGRAVRTAERFACSRCSYDECERCEIATAGGFLSRIFNVQHNKFVAVSCRACGFTELYKRTTGMTGNVVDFIVGS